MKTPDEIKKGLKICGDDECSNECPYHDNCYMEDAICELASDALAYIQQLEAAQMKWISVDERLPDEPGEVLACVYGRICIARYSNRCFETPSGMVFYACGNAVTHWMPLPQPPKDEL